MRKLGKPSTIASLLKHRRLDTAAMAGIAIVKDKNVLDGITQCFPIKLDVHHLRRGPHLRRISTNSVDVNMRFPTLFTHVLICRNLVTTGLVVHLGADHIPTSMGRFSEPENSEKFTVRACVRSIAR